MPPILLPIAEYAPDQPELIGTGSSNILNVYPRTSRSYGAVNSPSATLYGALNSRCQGAAAFTDKTGAVFLFAGSGSDLYYLTAGLSTWTNVSKSIGGYAIGSDQQWQFTYFNGDVIATNITDNPQAFTLGTGTQFRDLEGTPPRARYIGVVKYAFVVMGHTYDGTNGIMPQRLWWSAAGNAQEWPELGSNLGAELQSTAVDLLGPQGWIMGIAPDLANADAAIFQQYAVRRMMYVGPPNIFTLLPVESARGTPAPYSIISYGGIAYYLGQDGFAAFDGAESKPIGAGKVDKTFFAEVDLSNLHRVIGVADPLNKLMWWAAPSVAASSGNPDMLWCYNISIDRWSRAEVTCETLIRVLGIGYTLDELYTLLGYTLDTLPAPLDSPVWQGGRPGLAIFDTDHALNFMTGPPLPATVELNEIQPYPGKRGFVRGARPFVDGATPPPTVGIGRRETLQVQPTFTADVALNGLGVCPVRTSGRYLRGVVKIPQPDVGTTAMWTNISGVELDCTEQGLTR